MGSVYYSMSAVDSFAPWVIGSAAYRTVTPFKADFEFYEEFEDGMEVGVGFGPNMKVAGRGTIRLPSNVPGRTDDLVIKNAFHCPTVIKRIISVGSFTEEKGCAITMGKNCVMLDSSGKPLMNIPLDPIARLFNLYVYPKINQPKGKPKPPQAGENSISMIMRVMPDKPIQVKPVSPIPVPVTTTAPPSKAKTFKPAEFAGHIVSSRTISLHNYPSDNKNKCISVMIDHFTGYADARALPASTSDTILKHFTDFNAYLQKITKNDIVILRADVGESDRNAALIAFAREKGLKLEFCATSEDHDDGLIEKIIQSLIESIPPLLEEEKENLTNWFVPLAYEYSGYTHNFLPLQDTELSPNKKLKEKFGDIRGVESFGASCWALFDPYAQQYEPGIYVGWHEEYRAYKVVQDKTIRLSGDVTFF